jgi:hypothetical protein
MLHTAFSRTIQPFVVALLLVAMSQPLCSQASMLENPASESKAEAPSDTSVEHWDKLALKDNDLHPDPPIQGQLDNFPTFTRELIRVQWRSGDPIDLYIVRPSGVARPPVIIYLYGYPREAVRFLDPAFCRTVTRNGFAAVGFSSMLTGQRYHDVPMNEWFVTELAHSLTGTAHDLQMTINYLDSRSDFDTGRVGIFGEGSGGTIALLAASVDHRIRAVDVLNPWGDWSTWLAGSHIVPDKERPDYLKPEFLKPLATLDPARALPMLNRPAVRVQQTMWDVDLIPAVSRDHIAMALAHSAVIVRYKDEQEYLEKAGHDGKMLDWLYTALSR